MEVRRGLSVALLGPSRGLLPDVGPEEGGIKKKRAFRDFKKALRAPPHLRVKTVFPTGFGLQPVRFAQRSLALVDRGLARRSSGEARTTSSAIWQ